MLFFVYKKNYLCLRATNLGIGIKITSRGIINVKNSSNFGFIPHQLPITPLLAPSASISTGGTYSISGNAAGEITLPSANTNPGAIFVIRTTSAHQHSVTSSSGFAFDSTFGTGFSFDGINGSSVILMSDGLNFIVLGASGSLSFQGNEIETTITMPPSNWIEPSDYRAARQGSIGSTLNGAYLIIGEDDYVYWTQNDGAGIFQGVNPGLWVAELSGLTGHAVQLTSGHRSPAQVASSTMPVISGITGVTSAEVDNNNITITGLTITTGSVDFVSRGTAGIIGTLADTVDHTSYGEGGVANAITQHATSPSGISRVLAMDVLLGGTINTSDRFRLALYQGGSSTSPQSASLLYDFGQIAATHMVADSWVRLWVTGSSQTILSSSSDLWLAVRSDANTTFIGGYNPATFVGTFTAQNFRASDGSMATAAGTAWESTWQGGTTSATNFVLGLRLIYDRSPYVSNGSWEKTFGLSQNIVVGDFPIEIDFNGIVMNGTPVPSYYGLTLNWAEVAVGTTNPAGEQFRVAVYQGGTDDVSSPHTISPNGALLIRDFGQISSTGTSQWHRLSGSREVLTSGSLTWLAIKSNDSSSGPAILFANDPNWDTIDQPEDDADWYRPTGSGNGTEYEITVTNTNHSTDPTVVYENTITTDVSDLRPGNIPGLRLGLRISGISLS